MCSKKSSQAQPVHSRVSTGPISVPAERDRSLRDGSNRRFECPPWPPEDGLITESVDRILRNGDWGRYFPAVVEELRERIAGTLSVRHVRLVCSGSGAVELALRACLPDPARPPAANRPATPIAQADAEFLAPAPAEVICGVVDYPGNARAIRLLGALPVMVDVLPNRWTIDPQQIEAAATSQTAAVVVSHLYGEVAEVVAIRELCDRHGWSLIEDACQTPGASLAGKPVGTFGHIATWSFGGSKPLTAGCGGAVTTDDDRLAQRLAAFCDRPSDAFPLSPLQAAVLVPQWHRLNDWVGQQNERLASLIAQIAGATPDWAWPEAAPGVRKTHYKVPVRLVNGSDDEAHARVARLVDRAIGVGIPAGEPFRLPGRLAPSRGRIESADEARRMVARSWLLDHRALGGDARKLEELARCLIELHDNAK